MADNWCFCDEFCKLPQKKSGKFGESLYKLSKQGILKTVSRLVKTGFPPMMIGIVVFSMLVIGVVERSRAAVPSGGSGGSAGGSSGSGQMVTVGANASSTNASTSGSQQTSATKKTVQTNAAGQGQSQSSNQSQTKTQTKQTTKKKELQKSNPKAAVAARPRPQRVVGPRNAINAAAAR